MTLHVGNLPKHENGIVNSFFTIFKPVRAIKGSHSRM